MMLNCTTRKQVERILPEFRRRWPTPQAFAASSEDEVRELIRPLGFANRRTVALKKMTAAYLAGDWKHASELPGVGAYAASAHDVFCRGEVPLEPPNDHALRQYVVWYNKQFRSKK